MFVRLHSKPNLDFFFLWLCLLMNFNQKRFEFQHNRIFLTHQFICYLACNRFSIIYSNLIYLSRQSFMLLRKNICLEQYVINVRLFVQYYTFKLSAVFIQHCQCEYARVCESESRRGRGRNRSEDAENT